MNIALVIVVFVLVFISGSLFAQNRKLARSLRQLKEEGQMHSKIAITKHQLLEVLTHKSRNALNGIVGTSNLLMDTKLSKEQKHYAQLIRISIGTFLSVIKEVTDLINYDAGLSVKEQGEFNFRQCLDEVGDLLGDQAYAKGLGFHILVEKEIPSFVVGDPSCLRLILVNLVDNAIKFTSKGNVLLQVNLVSQWESQLTLKFSVKDTGIGLSQGKILAIKHLLHDVEGKSIDANNLNGAGLLMTQQLLETLGADLKVESRIGESSVFSFETQVTCTEEQPSPPFRGKASLVYAPKTRDAQVYEAYLAHMGCRVTHCKTLDAISEELVRAQRRHMPYPFLVMDVDELDWKDLEQIYLDDTQLIMVATPQVCKNYGLASHNVCMEKPLKYRHLLEVMAQDRTAEEEVAQEEAIARVLLVEDDPINQEIGQRLLEKMGYQCDVVDNGEECINHYHENRYDLILMDCSMPVMDGFEATQIIRKHEQDTDRYTPIIAMTANVLPQDREKCFKVGMNDHLSKPIDRGTLQRALMRQLT